MSEFSMNKTNQDKMKHIFQILIFLIHTCAYGQMEDYTYTRELKGVSEQWHKITLPDAMYADIQTHWNDIRIFGITSKGDTIEAPYLHRELTETVSKEEVNFELINQSRSDKGYYFTFKLPVKKPINQIQLDFKNRNFDWQVSLEGSQNQSEWFTILDKYRILSIKNELTDYQFTKLQFPDAKYTYFRVFVKSDKQADLKKAGISLQKTIEGKYNNHTIQKMDIVNDKKTKQTIIDLDLGQPLPVSYLGIDIKNDYDYYRPMAIKYLRDSFKTDKGWRYNYGDITSGIFNSLTDNSFNLSTNKTLQKLQIIIYNQDNEPLKIDEISVRGNVSELTARFTEPATYYLTYGNPKARKPKYDITRFTDKIPESLTELQLGAVRKSIKKEAPSTEPLFENKLWLWAVMLLIIMVLGGFSIQMMRKK